MDKQSKEVQKVERQLKKVTVSTEEIEALHQEQRQALTELVNRVGDATLSLTIVHRFQDASGFTSTI